MSDAYGGAGFGKEQIERISSISKKTHEEFGDGNSIKGVCESGSIWDLRSINVDQPKPLKEVSHNRAVQSAYFSASGSSLATTSMDNTVGIVTGVNFEHISMIELDNQINSRIAFFRAIWGWDDSYIFIGNRKRGVDAISSTRKRTIFTNPRMPAIPSRFDAHPCKVGMLAGATCWGHVYIWKLG